uniref:PLP-dependent aminotransferase family protein n=1 Tax=Ignisphaera aggregans TaxID=334771 RepID=A0A7J2U3A8_9CREN
MFGKSLKNLAKLYSKDVEAVLAIASSSLEIPEANADVINFASGLPDPRAIPVNDIEKILKHIIEEYGYKALQYTSSRGVPELINNIVAFMYRMRGLKTLPENILITAGSQQALDLITRLFVNPGEVVIVEEPSYILALHVLRLRGAKVVGVAIDRHGLRIDLLETTIKKLRREGEKIKLVYTMPLFQNPTGVSMSFERRKYLLELSEEHDLLIVEDDAYAFLGFDDSMIPALASEDQFGRVIYVSTFSKILSPGLRVGYLIAQEDVITKLSVVKQVIDLGSSTLSQLIAAKAIEKNVIEKNIAYIRKLYRVKKDLMVEALDEMLPKGIWRSDPGGGFYVWVKLNRNIDTEDILNLSNKRGVLFTPGKRFCVNQVPCKDAMRLSFSNPPENSIRVGIQILGDILRCKVR